MTYAMRVALLVLLLLLACRAQAQPPMDVRVGDHGLSVRAHAVPLRTLIERIGDLAGVEIVNADRLEGVASADVHERPVVEVLKTLLEEFNYVVTRKPRAVRGPVYVLGVHSRVGGASPARGPISVAALEAFHSEEIDTRTQMDLLNNPQGAEGDEDEDAAETTREVAELEVAGEFADTAPVTVLVGHLEDDNPLVRQRALVEISRRDSARALRHLIDLLDDDDLRVREQAVEILSHRSDAESLTELGTTVATRAIDAAGRIAAFRVIAFRAHPESAEFVRRVIADENPIIRAAARQFLEELTRRDGRALEVKVDWLKKRSA